jgi:phosphoribosylformylglycinamidine synthase
MKATVNISLKSGVLDSQGKAVHHALDSLNYKGINDVRVGKQIILDIDASSKKEAKKNIKKMCEDLLANTVIEDYTIEID